MFGELPEVQLEFDAQPTRGFVNSGCSIPCSVLVTCTGVAILHWGAHQPKSDSAGNYAASLQLNAVL